VRRIMDRNDAIAADKAESMARKTNKWRAEYYNFFTDKTWGDAKSYDLTLDSSRLKMADNVELVKAYLRLRGFID
ncbi:MAG: cytidylate kinase-like family protein, partial [Duncaniella sp.]|nr:cytidylate kinase-like family protein [Duncaniella sp.]